jgi:hypothetical protein
MQNAKTLASIRDLFQLLRSSGALLGRTKTHIVIDRQAMPEIIDIVMLGALDLQYEEGEVFSTQPVFKRVEFSSELLTLELRGDERVYETDRYFSQELDELQALFAAIPTLEEAAQQCIEACRASNKPEMDRLVEEMLQALLNGEIERRKDETRH